MVNVRVMVVGETIEFFNSHFIDLCNTYLAFPHCIASSEASLELKVLFELT